MPNTELNEAVTIEHQSKYVIDLNRVLTLHDLRTVLRLIEIRMNCCGEELRLFEVKSAEGDNFGDLHIIGEPVEGAKL